MLSTELDQTANENRRGQKNLLGLSFLHLANDLHSGVLPTIIPMLAQSISLTLAQAGILNSVFGMLHLFGQPVFGFIADKQKKPYSAVTGPVLCAAGACFLPLAPNYLSAILLVTLLGLGTAMFHPQGTGLCGRVGGDSNLAFFIAIFAACGTLGSAVGPVYVVYVVSALGKGGMPLMILPVVLICLYSFRNLDIENVAVDGRPAKKAAVGEFFRNIRSIMAKIGGIVTIATLRDATNLGIRLFIPTLVVSQGGTNKEGGYLVFAVTMASTISAMIGGKLADRIGSTKIVIGALSFSPPLLLAGLSVGGPAGVTLLILGFALLLASSSVTTAMSQQRCPGTRSMVSSLTMGISWGLANLFTSPVGYLADRIGLITTMRLVAFIPWTITLWYLFSHFKTVGIGRIKS